MAKHQRLVELRGKKTHEQIAAEIGMERSTYTHIENGTGRPSFRMALRIARFYGLNVEKLFGDLYVVNPHSEDDRSSSQATRSA